MAYKGAKVRTAMIDLRCPTCGRKFGRCIDIDAVTTVKCPICGAGVDITEGVKTMRDVLEEQE